MNSSQTSFLWYDFETFGNRPRVDRPSQFAAIRTDLALNPIGEPMNWHCQPAEELVPSPDACMITGITPQDCTRLGMPESEFARRIQHAMSQPQTCSAGYNSIRFDDEVTRFLFYRNLLPVYDREWRDGNSRWDLLDVVRFTHALRPEGMQWPRREDGHPSFRLEDLAAANDLGHEQAHDALSDVRATIALARKIRDTQPKLYEWALKCRDKAFVKAQIPVLKQQPFVHVSGMIPASQGCLTVLMPLGFHQTNKNEILCFDLTSDPTMLADLSVEEIAYRLFTPTDELGDTQRLPIKSVHANKCPMVGPISLFTDEVAERHGLDREAMSRHAQNMPDLKQVLPKVQQAMERTFEPMDAETALYDGFIKDRDQAILRDFHSTPPESWEQAAMPSDARLKTLCRRFIARHHTGPLSPDLQAEWQQYVQSALTTENLGSALTLDQAESRLQELSAEHPGNAVLAAVGEFLAGQRQKLG